MEHNTSTRKKFGKRVCLAAATLLLVWEAAGSVRVRADYRYDSFGNAIPSQYSYVAEAEYNGLQLGVGAFNTPTDLYVSREGQIYIVDAGNDRIVVLNNRYEVVKEIDDFRLEEESVSIKGVTGIFIHTDGLMYLADKGGVDGYWLRMRMAILSES